MMIPEVDIFVGNYTIIDPEAYSLWIAGYSVAEAVSEMQQQEAPDTSMDMLSLLMSDIGDHYRTFDLLEKDLQTRSNLAEQWTFQIHPAVQKFLIENYYEFDDVVIREFLGKKLTSRVRKDLEVVANKTGVLVRSCRRQFDNVKRILKQMDDMAGSLVQNIVSEFLLPLSLAQKYASIVLLMNNRFETSKKRLNYLCLDDYVNCASSVMTSWTLPDDVGQRETSEFDEDMLNQFRDLKVVLDREKEHRNVTLSHLRGKISDRICFEVESNFKTYSRALVNIATNLNNKRHFKDFFVDIVEKIIDTFKQSKWQHDEISTFLKIYTDTGSGLDIISSDPVLKATWERYMTVMQACIIQLYHF